MERRRVLRSWGRKNGIGIRDGLTKHQRRIRHAQFHSRKLKRRGPKKEKEEVTRLERVECFGIATYGTRKIDPETEGKEEDEEKI